MSLARTHPRRAANALIVALVFGGATFLSVGALEAPSTPELPWWLQSENPPDPELYARAHLPYEAPPPLPTCAEPLRFVEDLGEVCPDAEGRYLRFDDGTPTIVLAPHPELEDDVTGDVTTRNPYCVTSSTSYAWHALYVYPSGASSRYTSVVAEIRTRIQEANAAVYNRGQESSKTMDYRFLCSSSVITVTSIKSNQANAADFGAIKTDLRAKGYDSLYRKYLILWDGTKSGYCGEGTILDDERLVVDNYNNRGNYFAIVYLCSQSGSNTWKSSTIVHETFHTMGAVQKGAPNYVSGYHCDDGADYLCSTATACSATTKLDCARNDYFHPSPLSSNYLYNNWNMGNSLNRWIRKV